jgi:NADPH2:quinone reductase
MLTGEGRAHHGDIMREATRLVEAGKLVPRVDPRHFELSSVGEAYRAIESNDATGKIVVATSHLA